MRTTSVWLTVLLGLSACTPPPADLSFADTDWPAYGGDPGSMQYSPLDVIDRSNVATLEVAWTWETGEEPVPGPLLPVPGQPVRPGNFETTPVVINDTMYLSTPYNRAVALDAGSGRQIWSYDPRTVEWGQPPNGTGFVHRGVAVWSGRSGRRVFLNTRWRLIALDAATGTRIRAFGHEGEIDLTEQLLWPTNRLHYTQTSPPLIYEDLVILGNGVWDRFVYPQDPPGNIQAFDVFTGDLVWSFNLIPQEGEVGNETWEDGSWRSTGHSNAWAPLSVDEERGLLYVPVGTPSNDYYGGHRKGDNLFAESLVCLDAATGELVWQFQTVRHGLWDYDLPGTPTLLTIEHEGQSIDVVAVASKTGFVYVFNRETGEPVWPIEDRPVPQSDVTGEQTAATQPFPTNPPPISRQGFSEDDLIDFTPALRARARESIASYRLGPLFLPPSFEGSIAMPGILGGANWGGIAADPESGIIYVKTSEQPALLPIAVADSTIMISDYALDTSRPRGLTVDGLPIQKPPYGAVVAMDLNSGEHVWSQPVGDRPDVRSHPALRGVALPERLGIVGAPGPVVTAGGLVFLTGGSSTLYAFDKSTGELLWEGELESRGYANPMSFGTTDRRQFVAIATGAARGSRLVVFGLPE